MTYGVKAVCDVLQMDTDIYYYYISKIKTTTWYFKDGVLEQMQVISDFSIENKVIGPVYGAKKLASGYNEITKKQTGNIMTKYITTKVMTS